MEEVQIARGGGGLLSGNLGAFNHPDIPNRNRKNNESTILYLMSNTPN